VWRSAEALFVRGLVDDVMSAHGPDAAVAVVGDLNDVPGSAAVRTVRGEGPGELFDCAANVDPDARFSCLHDGRKAQIDHVLASASLHARLETARFLNAGLTSHPPPVKGEPVLPTADSDHAPLVVGFGA
jgi:predicted extracellular nuclease